MKTNSIEKLTRANSVASSRVIAACLIALSVWATVQITGISPLDGTVYDLCARAQSNLAHTPSRVILVTSEPGSFKRNRDSVVPLLERLEGLGASAIGLAFVPDTETFDLIRTYATGSRCPIVVGQAVVQNPGNGELIVWSHRSNASQQDAAEEKINFGLMRIDPSASGTCRSQSYNFRTTSGTFPSLETRLAACALPNAFHLRSAKDYRVKFAGPPESLPRVHAGDVLAGRLVPELVSGRVVMIGLSQGLTTPGLSTPTTNTRNRMSTLEFHGNALNSLLTLQEIQPVSAGMAFVILMLTSLLVLTICYPLRWLVTLQFMLSLVFVQVVVSVWLLVSYHLWLPLSQMFLVQAICFGAVHQRRCATLVSKIESAHRSLQTRFGSTIEFDLALDREHDVGQVVDVVATLLALDRVALLRADRRSSKLEVAFERNGKGLAIQTDDLREAPFAEVPLEHGIVRKPATEYPLFTDYAPNEQHVLIRLSVARRTLGFLVAAINDTSVLKYQDVDAVLQKYSEQVSKLIYQAQHREMRKERSLLARVFNAAPEQIRTDQLLRMVGAAERRLVRTENAVEHSLVAFAVCDAFGNLVVTNGRMTKVVQSISSEPAKSTVFELLTGILDCQPDEARKLVHNAIYHGQTWTKVLPSKSVELDGTNAVSTTDRPSSCSGSPRFVLRPLTVDGFSSVELAGPDLFGVKGLVCEFFEDERQPNKSHVLSLTLDVPLANGSTLAT